MAVPEGSIQDVGAKIHAFKRHQATQPMDPVSRRLLPLKIGIFFQTGDVDRAVEEGVGAVGWQYNGHEYVETERYMGLFHEVAPKERALTCSNCHYGGTRLDFDSLGYTPKTEYNGKPLCVAAMRTNQMIWNTESSRTCIVFIPEDSTVLAAMDSRPPIERRSDGEPQSNRPSPDAIIAVGISGSVTEIP